MRVKISDLVLWQWRPSLMNTSNMIEHYDGEDEKTVRWFMRAYRHGNVPPISIKKWDKEVDDFPLSPKALKMLESGKWMVWDGFHRIYAARRLGYKTIKAEFY